MKTNLTWVKSGVSVAFVVMAPSSAFCESDGQVDGNLWGSVLVYAALVILVLLLLALMRSAVRLSETSNHNKVEGKEWIHQKLYDFDAEQLDFLIREIKIKNHNRTQETDKLNK